jgi:cysteine desulfurase
MGALTDMMTDDVLLVSVMTANNEIGVVQPIKDIAALCHQNGALFHTDAAQTGCENLNVFDADIDFLSLSAHKIYGPKGIGALFISQDAELKPSPIIYGGGQQSGYRSGTVPMFLTVGLGEACRIMQAERYDESIRMKQLRQQLLAGLQRIFPDLRVNGSMEHRHPGNLNVTLPCRNAKQLILSLQPHLAFSTGSACTSGIIEPSHVLKAIGLSTEDADCSFRLCIGRQTTEKDIVKTIEFFSKSP